MNGKKNFFTALHNTIPKSFTIKKNWWKLKIEQIMNENVTEHHKITKINNIH